MMNPPFINGQQTNPQASHPFPGQPMSGQNGMNPGKGFNAPNGPPDHFNQPPLMHSQAPSSHAQPQQMWPSNAPSSNHFNPNQLADGMNSMDLSALPNQKPPSQPSFYPVPPQPLQHLQKSQMQQPLQSYQHQPLQQHQPPPPQQNQPPHQQNQPPPQQNQPQPNHLPPQQNQLHPQPNQLPPQQNQQQPPQHQLHQPQFQPMMPPPSTAHQPPSSQPSFAQQRPPFPAPLQPNMPPQFPPQMYQPNQPPQGPPGHVINQRNQAPFPLMNQQPPQMFGAPPNQPNSFYPPQQPGFPPNQPPSMDAGYNPGGIPAGRPPFQQASFNQAPQPRRLDPDHMPSQIQVLAQDNEQRAGVFQTGARGSMPPLITTDFITEDQGCCNPRFMRSTMYNIPCTSDLMKQSNLPFALTISPFAQLLPKELPPPIIDLGQMGPVRCNRCKAYMCPFMMFVDGGRKFQCVFCNCSTEVPPEYFAHLDHTGRRVDCYDRPELCLGAYEFAATIDYCKDGKLPNEPAFIFMIDISYNSVKSGLVNLLCSRLKQDILSHLPKDVGDEESGVRIGFVTYAKELHFYNIKGTLVQPQVLVVSDINDVFVPLVDGFLVKLSEAEAIVDSLLVQISQMFSDTRETEVVLGPVIQAGLDALKSAERAGKLVIFHSSMPTFEAPGKLKNRDDRSVLGTEKEKTLLSPQSTFYTKLGQECVAAGCSVDLFLFPNSYIDVATIGEVCRLTGGSVFKYNYFQAEVDGENLMADMKAHLSKEIAFDVVLRVRTSTGIRAVDFYGNFYMSNTTDVELASVVSDKAISVEVRHDDKLTEAEGAHVQAAVLYTSVAGKRRLRILNMSFNCCTQIAELFRNCELDSLINFMAKKSMRVSLNSSVKQVREHLTSKCVNILTCYRKNCAGPSATGQLILPEGLKLLPVYANSIVKSPIFQSDNISTDDRSHQMHMVNSMTIASTVAYFYSRVLPLTGLDLSVTSLPIAIRSSHEKLKENSVYLIENGLLMYMWVGVATPVEWLQQVFGVASVAQVDSEKSKLQPLENPLSIRVRGIVGQIRQERKRHMKLLIVKQKDKLEALMHVVFSEDKSSAKTHSYVDYLCHLHKEIRNNLL